MTTHERDRAHSGADQNSEWYKEELEDSAEFRKSYRNRLSVVKPKDMPFENSPDGLIKHLVHEKQDTTENCVEAYMQFIKPGSHTGKRRILAEQILRRRGRRLRSPLGCGVRGRYRIPLVVEGRTPQVRMGTRRLHFRAGVPHPAALQFRS